MSSTVIPSARYPEITPRGEELASRILESVTAASELLTIELGRRLGLYTALADAAETTAPQLARRAGIAPRYAREWLEQQAAAGILDVVEASDVADNRGYRLPEAHAEVLLDEEHPLHMMGAAQLLAGIALTLPEVEEAYRAGRGIPFERFGAELREGIATLNRPGFARDLGSWISTMPDIAASLNRGGMVLDAGCGTGWSTVAIAHAFPNVRVIGIDLDATSIEAARRNAEEAGVANRVVFVRGNTADADSVEPLFAGDCVLVTVFEALHDMGSPVRALQRFRSVLAPGGAVLVADERVADEFVAPAGEIERFQYAVSVLHCLPATLAESDDTANGTVLRAPTVRLWADEAGFTRTVELPVEHEFWRFYRLD